MLKRYSTFLYCVVCISFLIVVSCSKNKGALDDIGGPKWIFDAYAVSKPTSGLAAVGISDKTKGGIKMQITQAENDAIANIASQMQTKVSRVVEDRVNQIYNVSSSETEKSNSPNASSATEEVKKSFSSVTKNIVDNIPVSGFKRTDIWLDPKVGTLYVRVEIDFQRIGDHFNKMVSMYRKVDGVDKKNVDRLINAVLGVTQLGKMENENKNDSLSNTSSSKDSDNKN